MKINNFRGMCYIPYLNVRCYHHTCNCCDIADRYRQRQSDHTKKTNDLFDHTNVLRKTEKGGGLEYVYRPIILKPEAMSAKGIEVCMWNQILISTDGGGMFSHNPGGEIDGYLVSDRYRTKTIYTFGRQDFYGVPDERAVERFRELFLIDLHSFERKVTPMI